MKKLTSVFGRMPRLVPLLIAGASLLVINGCRKFDNIHKLHTDYDQVNLVDNNGEYQALHMDPTLINAWGIAFSPTGVPWVNSQGGHVSEVYDKEGAIVRNPVNVPLPDKPTGGNPTGIVFNGSTGFVLSNGAAARFIFVGVDGVLSGWNSGKGDTAENISADPANSSYTGLAIGMNQGATYLYAADFKAGKIQVWDTLFTAVNMPFNDPQLPSGFAPFNIQAIGDWLYVLYAKVGTDGRDEKGQGLGYVSIFKTNGEFVKRFASKGALNAPWGIAKAPSSFFNDDEMWKTGGQGKNEGKDIILVGNFGDGYINAYSSDGSFIGALKSNGHPIWIDGLWAISFAPASATAVDPNRLYFAAGPDEEADGLFGYIIKK